MTNYKNLEEMIIDEFTDCDNCGYPIRSGKCVSDTSEGLLCELCAAEKEYPVTHRAIRE